MTLNIVVPQSRSSITQGSGVVAAHSDEGVRVYFEGNLYGADNLHHIDGRLQCAAGRLMTRYPTIARQILSTEAFGTAFLVVGEYDYDTHTYVIFEECKAIWDDWVGLYSTNQHLNG